MYLVHFGYISICSDFSMGVTQSISELLYLKA